MVVILLLLHCVILVRCGNLYQLKQLVSLLPSFFASKAIAPKALRSLRFMVWVATTKLCLLSTAA
jgi:hypothetical protein